MRRWAGWLLAGVLLLCGAVALCETDPVEDAKALVEGVVAGDVDAYYGRLSQTLQEVFPREVMASIGEEIRAMGGGRRGWGEAEAKDGHVVLVLEMERGTIRSEVAFGAGGEVTGLWFDPLTLRENTGEPYVEVLEHCDGELAVGTEVTLQAVLHNVPGDMQASYQWQNDASGMFESVAGATGAEHTFIVGVDYPAGCEWRVNVYFEP